MTDAAQVGGGRDDAAVLRGLADLRRRKRVRLTLGLGYLPFFGALGYATGSRTATMVGVVIYMVICQVAHNAVLSWTCPVCGAQVHVYQLFGWITSARGTPRACPRCGRSLRSSS